MRQKDVALILNGLASGYLWEKNKPTVMRYE